jgi:hypothetical protein
MRMRCCDAREARLEAGWRGAHQAVRDYDGLLAAQRERQLRRRVGAARRSADGVGADGADSEARGGGDLGAECGAGCT